MVHVQLKWRKNDGCCWAQCCIVIKRNRENICHTQRHTQAVSGARCDDALTEYGKCEICAITWNCIRMTMLHIFVVVVLFIYLLWLAFMHQQAGWRVGDEGEEEWTHAPYSVHMQCVPIQSCNRRQKLILSSMIIMAGIFKRNTTIPTIWMTETEEGKISKKEKKCRTMSKSCNEYDEDGVPRK